MAFRTCAKMDDLLRVEGRAEIVNGEVVHLPALGWMPYRAAFEVFSSLRLYVRETKRGMAVSGNAAFEISLPHRMSFSPHAAFYEGPNPGMKFFAGAPRFAVEVRSLGDYRPAADADYAQKRADYFATGTLVVWDVDLLGEDVVRAYRSTDPTTPVIFRRGQTADAEPAVPGWSMLVNELFEEWPLSGEPIATDRFP